MGDFIAFLVFILIIGFIIYNFEEIIKVILFMSVFIFIIGIIAASCSNLDRINNQYSYNKQEKISCPECPSCKEQLTELSHKINRDIDSYHKLPSNTPPEIREKYLKLFDLNLAYLQEKIEEKDSIISKAQIKLIENQRLILESLTKSEKSQISHKKKIANQTKMIASMRQELEKDRKYQLWNNLKLAYLGIIGGWLFSVFFPYKPIKNKPKDINFIETKTAKNLIATKEISILLQNTIFPPHSSLKTYTHSLNLTLNKIRKSFATVIVLTIPMVVIEYYTFY